MRVNTLIYEGGICETTRISMLNPLRAEDMRIAFTGTLQQTLEELLHQCQPYTFVSDAFVSRATPITICV